MRELTFAESINEALFQVMDLSNEVLVLGQLVDYQPGVFGTTTGLFEKFGKERVRDFPVSESAMTSAAIGASLVGLRPVLVHQRLDFMMYSLDAIVNWLSLWRFKSNGESGAPVTIRAVVGKGWGQGPQHSKSLHSWFAHLPGLRVAVPATAYDVKGLLMESILGEDPAIIIENRSLFSMKTHVPEDPYRVRFGQACIFGKGTDLSIICIGVMVPVALRVAAMLVEKDIRAQVVDLRSLSPLDKERICESVAQTRRFVVLDPGWEAFGASGEIISVVCEELAGELEANPLRVCLPNSHTPMSSALEAMYYPTEDTVLQRILEWLNIN